MHARLRIEDENETNLGSECNETIRKQAITALFLAAETIER